MLEQLPHELKLLVQSLTQLPSVGQRSGLRYAMNMLQWSKERRQEFAKRILSLDELKSCKVCGAYVTKEHNECNVCKDSQRRESKILCIVENFQDYLAVERGGYYKGVYHILGGVLNPLMGISAEQLGIDRLVERVKSENISQVILALNPSLEGDATCAYLVELLSEYCDIERIGLGVPMGSHLEYLDNQTILSALQNRKKFPKQDIVQ